MAPEMNAILILPVSRATNDKFGLAISQIRVRSVHIVRPRWVARIDPGVDVTARPDAHELPLLDAPRPSAHTPVGEIAIEVVGEKH